MVNHRISIVILCILRRLLKKRKKVFPGIIILQAKIGLLNKYYIQGVQDNHKMGSAWWGLFFQILNRKQ